METHYFTNGPKKVITIYFSVLISLNTYLSDNSLQNSTTYIVESVQDFLLKLGIKPLMQLLEISIFSLSNDIVRLTKIMNNLVKDLTILNFSHFSVSKIDRIFPKKTFCEEYLIRRQT